MKCYVCKHKFIITQNNSEYLMRKSIMETVLSNYIDAMYELDEIGCWNVVLQTENMLLEPNEKPIDLFIGNTRKYICKLCYKKKIDKISENYSAISNGIIADDG